MCVCVNIYSHGEMACLCAQSSRTLFNPMDCNPPGCSVHGIFLGKYTGVGCHFLFKGNFPIQRLNSSLLCLLHCQADSLPLNHLGSPYIITCKYKFHVSLFYKNIAYKSIDLPLPAWHLRFPTEKDLFSSTHQKTWESSSEKSRDITLTTKVCLVKAMVFPIVMYACESWTIKKAEHQRTDALELWCWRRFLRVPWTVRRSNQSFLKEISPEYSLEGLILKLKLQYFGHLMRSTDSFEKILMLGKIEGGRKGDDRRWDGWMASPTQWTWVWVSFGSWWWTGRPGVLQSMRSQRAGHDWATELSWTEVKRRWLRAREAVSSLGLTYVWTRPGNITRSVWAQQGFHTQF